MVVKYFNNMGNLASVFFEPPCSFNLSSSKEVLAHALGATLYMGADRPNLLKDLLSSNSCSVVVCLEDSVASNNLQQAERNVFKLFREIESMANSDETILETLPLIFLRIRSLHQLNMYLENSSLTGLCGFIVPKFSSIDGPEYLSSVQAFNKKNKTSFYVMPILETPEIIFKETRINELSKIKSIVDHYKDIVLNIRIGGTDLSGIYSLRRNRDFTIYDISVIKDCICDIINFFKRDDYVISAPVNEYFTLDANLDNSTLVKEVRLDRLNGLIGKTVIHPNQANVVNSLMAVTKEEYLDAKTIVSSSSDGVLKSTYSNKMNEVKPHLKWADKIMLLSKIMGVLNDEKNYKDILKLNNEFSYWSKSYGILTYK